MITRLKALARKAWANDTVQRTVHTFWQAASATAIAEFGGSGLDVKTLTDISADEKIVIAAVVAGGSAVLAMLRGAAKTAIANRALNPETSPLLDVPDTPDPLEPIHDPAPAAPAVPGAAPVDPTPAAPVTS